ASVPATPDSARLATSSTPRNAAAAALTFRHPSGRCRSPSARTLAARTAGVRDRAASCSWVRSRNVSNGGGANTRRVWAHSGPANVGPGAALIPSARAGVFNSPVGMNSRKPSANDAQAGPVGLLRFAVVGRRGGVDLAADTLLELPQAPATFAERVQ